MLPLATIIDNLRYLSVAFLLFPGTTRLELISPNLELGVLPL